MFVYIIRMHRGQRLTLIIFLSLSLLYFFSVHETNSPTQLGSLPATPEINEPLVTPELGLQAHASTPSFYVSDYPTSSLLTELFLYPGFLPFKNIIIRGLRRSVVKNIVF